MSSLGAVLGVVIACAAVFYWYKWYKSVKGEAQMPGWSSGPADKPGGESLEAFIAAYRSGDVTVKDAAAAAPKAAATPLPAVSRSPAATAVPAMPVPRDSFLTGANKLGFLLCKSALRDHHVFAHVPLRHLAGSGIDPAVGDATVDLLICNASLRAIAAIDITGADTPPPGAAKVQALRDLKIRYLRLSAKSLPRPEQLRDLLYRM